MQAPVPPLRRAAAGLGTRAARQVSLAREYLEELLEMRVVDRALALASKLFIAILPLSILVTAVVSGETFGDELVSRFGLTGAGARAARSLFAAPAQVQAGMGLLGVVILTSSVLSFASALQRVYLDAWRLPPAPGGAPNRLVWLAGLVVWVTAMSILHEALESTNAGAVSWVIAVGGGGAFFLWTPYLLLGRRVSARRLLTTAIATGAALGVLAVGSDIVMPELVTTNTERYGLIGLTFSLVSWLFCGAVLVVAAVVLGALLDRRTGPDAEPPPRHGGVRLRSIVRSG